MKPERVYIEERGDGKLQVVAHFATHETVIGECPREMQVWLESALSRHPRPAKAATSNAAPLTPEQAVS